MARRGKGRRDAVDGILLLCKPPGLSSNQALQRVKHALNAEKAGHTGSLDPAATGMLPLCFGEATKVSAFLLDSDKTYRVVARLGERTDSGDATGSIVEEAAVPGLTADEWREILASFLGDSMQVPPMYSALKKDGKRLYELARRGEEVERAPRPIRIFAIELLESRGRRLVFRVECSKGTYVRTLVEDIARKAGTVAYTHSLHREAVAGFDESRMLSMTAVDSLERESLKAGLLPPDQGLLSLPAVSVADEATGAFRDGQRVASLAGEPAPAVRVYCESGEFLGVAECSTDGKVSPKRVFRSSAVKE